MSPRARFVIVEETKSTRECGVDELWTVWWLEDESTGKKLRGWTGNYRDEDGVRTDDVGITSAELAPDGLHVLVRHGRAQLQVVTIPGTEGLSPLSPWTPPPPLPISAFGITVDGGTDLSALIGDIAPVRSPQLLVELYEQLRFTPRFEEFAQIVADGFDSADPRFRSAALYFLARYPQIAAFEVLVKRLERDPVGEGTTPVPTWPNHVLAAHDVPRAATATAPAVTMTMTVPAQLLVNRIRDRSEAELPPDELDRRAAAVLETLLAEPSGRWPNGRGSTLGAQRAVAIASGTERS